MHDHVSNIRPHIPVGKPPPPGTRCGDCRQSREILTYFRRGDGGGPLSSLCHACAGIRRQRGEEVVSHDLTETHRELLDRVAGRLRAELGARLMRGTPLKELSAIVSTSLHGGDFGNPSVAVLERKGMLQALDESLTKLAELPPGVVDPDAFREQRREIAALPFLRAFRRAPPRGAIWVLVIPDAMGEALPFWP